MKSIKTKNDLLKAVEKMEACREAIEWVAAQPGTVVDIWQSCPCGDWLLWFAARRKCERKAIVLAACACARLALKYLPADEFRPIHAIEAAEAWCQGKVTLSKVQLAAYAAYASASAAYASAAYTASASAYAAYAAYASAYAVYASASTYTASAASASAYAAYATSAYTASASAYATSAFAAYATSASILQQCADITRQHITPAMVGLVTP